MATFEAIAEIHAPAGRTWNVMSAVEAWSQWMPTVSGVERLGALLGVIFGKLTRNYLDQEARALKLRAEQGE